MFGSKAGDVIPSDPKVIRVEVQSFHRLNKDQYDQLVKGLPRLGTPNDAIQAGMLVGIQLVLEKLRDGFVVEGPAQ